MKWFKKHPEHLESEVRELDANSNYNAVYTRRNNLLVSCGEIIVRSKHTLKYPVLIVFPEATPYSLPRVYLLDRLFSEDEVEKISALEISQIAELIKSNVKFYHLRHQGSDGSLCLLEADNLYLEAAQTYSVRQVINRVRDWFAGLGTGRLPPDSPEVELFAHFKNKNTSLTFLLPDFVFDDQFTEGIIYAAQTPTSQILFRNYICVTMFGKNKSGVLLPPKIFSNEKHLLFTSIPKPSEIIKYEADNSQSKEIKDKIQLGEMVRFYWFDITVEPKPFETIDELIAYIGNSDRTLGGKKIVEWLDKEIGKAEIIFVGLRFPGRKGQKEWQLFSLSKRKDCYPLFSPTFEMKLEMLSKYDIQAISSEEFTDQKYHVRNSSRADRDVLKNKKITIIGCGALGSEIADIVNKGGVGEIRLVDKELFKAHNSVRHLVSIEKTGSPKVLAVAGNLTLHNPFTNINLALHNPFTNINLDYNFLDGDILSNNINAYFLEDSIGISTIADDNTEAYLNEQAVIYNKPLIYARALRGGKVGRIFRVVPGKDACKNCLALYKLEKDPRFIEIAEDKALPTITNECNNPIRPASAADLKMIASVTARIIMDYLQTGEEDANHWIWTTEKLEGIVFDEKVPFALHSSFLPPHPKCKYCQKEDPVKIEINSQALKSMRAEIARDPKIETGGVLIGYTKQSGNVVVEFATDPGPKAIKEPSRFIRDVEYCQKMVNEFYQKLGDKGLYIGEWHYHPNPNNRPSSIDLLSLSEIAGQKEYTLDKPIMLIFSNADDLSCTVHPFNKKYYFTKYSEV